MNADTPIFVSLGSFCEPAIKMKEHKIRTFAFPFDWLITQDHQGFIRILDEDFRYFHDSNTLFQHPNSSQVIENGHYQIEFRHEWLLEETLTDSLRYLKQIEEIQSKYQRRIERFRDLRNHPGKVIFIRSAYDFIFAGPFYWQDTGLSQITNEEAKELEAALERFFPQLDFMLVIINFEDETTQKITGINRVVEFFVNRKNRHLSYQKIFSKCIKMGK